jgi:hypothetical protein
VVACSDVLHQPLVIEPSLNAAGLKSQTFSNIESALSRLQIPSSIRRQITYSELNPACGETGTVVSYDAKYDGICSDAIALVLASKQSEVMRGEHNLKRFRSADQLIVGVSIDATTVNTCSRC